MELNGTLEALLQYSRPALSLGNLKSLGVPRPRGRPGCETLPNVGRRSTLPPLPPARTTESIIIPAAGADEGLIGSIFACLFCPNLWSGLVYYRGRVTPLSVRSWRGAFTTSPHGPEFAAGSGFGCRSHGATNLGFLPHSTLALSAAPPRHLLHCAYHTAQQRRAQGAGRSRLSLKQGKLKAFSLVCWP